MNIFSSNNVRSRAQGVSKEIFSKNYISQFEFSVKNFEQMLEEENILKSKAVYMRLASYFG